MNTTETECVCVCWGHVLLKVSDLHVRSCKHKEASSVMTAILHREACGNRTRSVVRDAGLNPTPTVGC